MDSLTLKDIPALLPCKEPFGPAMPHYHGPTLNNLLCVAKDWSDKFTPNINRMLKELPDMDVLVDNGRPIVSSSAVVGQVSWMEDFTLFAIHPDRDWDVDLPRAVVASEYDLTVNCAMDYKGSNGVEGRALVYDPSLPLKAKQRADIARAVKSLGEVEVSHGTLPLTSDLMAGVKRWDRHAMSGDYFLWQWLWVSVAGTSIKITGEDFTCWIGFVRYGDKRVFTAYHAVGDRNGMGTGCLELAMSTLEPLKTVLTAPMLPDQAKRHNVERYETYKRRFANSDLPVHFLRGRWRSDELPYPPYYNAQLQETIHV